MVRKGVVLVAALVLLAGCASMGSGSGDSGAQPQAASGGADAGAPGDGGGGGADGGGGGNGGSGGDAGSKQSFSSSDDGSGGAAANVDRALIKTGTVRVEVENYSTAEAATGARASELGGYVSSSDVTLHRTNNETWRTGYVEVRVPSENFTAMFESSRGQGTVLAADSNTEDVTDQLVDLNARLENLEAERDRLRTLYESANTTEDLLRVQERLSEVQGEIERLEAKQRSLEDQVAFSTLRIELREPRPEGDRTPRPAFHEQSPVSAFLNSVQGFLTFGRTVLIACVAAVPWVVGLGVPALLVVRFGRRVWSPSGLPLIGRGSKSTGEHPPVDEDQAPLKQAFDDDESGEGPGDEGQDDQS